MVNFTRLFPALSISIVLLLLVPAESLTVSGTVSEHTRKADSGNVVRAGNLDDPSSVRPGMNIWASSAPGPGLTVPARGIQVHAVIAGLAMAPACRR